MSKHSTREVAKKLGLHLATIQRYIAEGKIPVPPVLEVGGGKLRVWTDQDIQRVRKILPKIANGRKTRYQKLREKQKIGGAQARAPVLHKQKKKKKQKPR